VKNGTPGRNLTCNLAVRSLAADAVIELHRVSYDIATARRKIQGAGLRE
jgi:hypothetical protein